jgi:uncharacterized protein YdbL (DUF1318 family)
MMVTLVYGLLAMTTAGVMAQDLAKVQEQMKKRLPELAQLKTQKVVGETSAGFVALAKAAADAKARQLVDAENADRKVVYASIAAKTGSDAARVGQQRGKEIAERSAPGMMLQREDGTWYEKK